MPADSSPPRHAGWTRCVMEANPELLRALHGHSWTWAPQEWSAPSFLADGWEWTRFGPVLGYREVLPGPTPRNQRHFFSCLHLPPALDTGEPGGDWLRGDWLDPQDKIMTRLKTCQGHLTSECLLPVTGGKNLDESHHILRLLSEEQGHGAEPPEKLQPLPLLAPFRPTHSPLPRHHTAPSPSRHQMAPSLCLSPSRQFGPLPVPVRGSKPGLRQDRTRHPVALRTHF